jgi:hypothetical protein
MKSLSVARVAHHVAGRDTIVRRIRNVARRSGFTQPERRIVSIGRDESRLEVLTTSQKLAHRIASELVKAFGGRASFAGRARTVASSQCGKPSAASLR